jgi:hypothetical protein
VTSGPTRPAPGSELATALANVTAAVIGAVLRGATLEQITEAAERGVRLGRRSNTSGGRAG